MGLCHVESVSVIGMFSWDSQTHMAWTHLSEHPVLFGVWYFVRVISLIFIFQDRSAILGSRLSTSCYFKINNVYDLCGFDGLQCLDSGHCPDAPPFTSPVRVQCLNTGSTTVCADIPAGKCNPVVVNVLFPIIKRIMSFIHSM